MSQNGAKMGRKRAKNDEKWRKMGRKWAENGEKGCFWGRGALWRCGARFVPPLSRRNSVGKVVWGVLVGGDALWTMRTLSDHFFLCPVP